MDDLSSKIENENEIRDMFLETPVITPEVSGASKDTFVRFTDSASLSSSNESIPNVTESKFQTILTFFKKNILLSIICLISLLIIGELFMATSKYKIENENLRQKIETLSKEKAAIENKHNEVLTELEKVKTESQNQINALNTNIENIRALCKEARENLDNVNKQLETLKEEHQKVLSKNTELSNTVQTLENDLNKAPQPKQSFFRKLWPFK